MLPIYRYSQMLPVRDSGGRIETPIQTFTSSIQSLNVDHRLFVMPSLP